jgi:hypothetical protein
VPQVIEVLRRTDSLGCHPTGSARCWKFKGGYAHREMISISGAFPCARFLDILFGFYYLYLCLLFGLTTSI